MLGIVCLLFALNAYTISASFIKPCKPEDSACIISSATQAIPFFAKGQPEMGIEPMDPLKLELIKSDQGGLKIIFKDSTLTGLKDCSVENIKYDTSKMKQHVALKCNLVLTGDYNIDGQLLILTAQGEGKYKIDIRDMLIKAVIDISTVNGKDGKPHWHISKWTYTFDVLTGTTFDFENLFNGNKALAQPVLDFVNTSWKDVMLEIAPPIVDAIVAKVVHSVESLYKFFPIDQLQE
ncbi:protein takeout-like [Vanessa cardui]|uniref:protein takeout-like n=1 Tax=Vanessa cardui TaxID=171605 RepID=UPI001F1300D0|nr:protein takeout-like [Vanessa cardui]